MLKDAIHFAGLYIAFTNGLVVLGDRAVDITHVVEAQASGMFATCPLAPVAARP